MSCSTLPLLFFPHQWHGIVRSFLNLWSETCNKEFDYPTSILISTCPKVRLLSLSSPPRLSHNNHILLYYFPSPGERIANSNPTISKHLSSLPLISIPINTWWFLFSLFFLWIIIMLLHCWQCSSNMQIWSICFPI